MKKTTSLFIPLAGNPDWNGSVLVEGASRLMPAKRDRGLTEIILTKV